MKTIQFTLNGKPRQFETEPDRLLIETLRETFAIKSVKSGCSPQRECGACLILFDGQPKLACAVRAEQVQGRSIVTLEGVSDNERRLYADAFQAAAGLQCGFCTPGFVLRIKWMTDQGERLTRAEIARLIDGHLCRCTGYVKIIDAIELIQEAKLGGGALPAIVEDGGVGKSLRRYQGAELALGERPFVVDIDAPGLLHGALVLSPHARAKVQRIDVSKARAAPGVVAVATAADVPGDRWVGQIVPDWPVFVAEGEEARYVGDVLAAVAAETPRLAREAAALVAVEYEQLRPGARPGRGDPARRAAGQSAARQRPLDDALRPRRRRGGAGGLRPCRQRRMADAAHRAPVPRARGLPRPAAARRPPARVHPGPGHLRGSPPDRFRPRRAGRPRVRRARPERRRVRRQGGHDDPGADGAARAPGRAPGQDRAQPRRVGPHASQAPPDDHDLYRRLRRGWAPDRGQDPYSRRLGRLRLGRRQGARARRRPRLRAVPDARARGRGGGGLHQQSAVRRDARLRRQPDELRHRGLPRPARGQGRPRRLGNALAEHRAGRRSDDHRTGSRKVCRGREDPACGEAGL